jgi:hypothetical protein
MNATTKIEKARTVLELCERLGIKVIALPVLRPASKVTPEIEKAAREVADELLQLLGREWLEVGCVPCRHCKGAGLEPTALMLFEQLKDALLCLMWDPLRVERLRTELKSDEVLAGMPRQCGIDLVDTNGNQRTLGRFDS